jgi:hypothetical protein
VGFGPGARACIRAWGAWMLRYGRSKSVCFAAERALSNRSSLIGRSEASAFQTFRGRIVGVAREPALLSGIGAQRPFQYGIRRRGGTISVAALRQTNGRPDRFTNSPHPSSREGHHSTTRRIQISSYCSCPHRSHAAAMCCLVHWQSVPLTHIRCMTTAIRRATATIARFIPLR